MSLTVKAYLYEEWLKEPIETRRFALDQDVATNYTYLTEKLAQTFPQVEAQNITISYLDGDGDRVTVSTDEELTDALDQFDGTVFRLHIKKRNTSSSEQHTTEQHPFLPPFMGYRGPPRRHGWGRRQCPFNPAAAWLQHAAATAAAAGSCKPDSNQTTTTDSTPQQKEDGVSTESTNEPQTADDTTSTTTHEDVPPRPKQDGAEDHPKGPHHPGVVCDGCNNSIYGRRFKCTTCPDYDLCGDCEGKGLHTDHNMYTIDEPRQRSQCPSAGNGQQNPWAGLFGAGPFNFGFGPFGGTFELWGHPGRCGGGQNPFQQAGGVPWGGCQWGTGQRCNPTQNKDETEKMETGEATNPSDPSPNDSINEAFKEVLDQLQSMGFIDEGGWLYELVKAKDGNLQKILDALHPTAEN